MKYGHYVPLCCLIGVSLAWQNNPPTATGDAMEVESFKLAGPNAIDCGRVHVRESPKTSTDCALAAFKAHKPFRVRYGLQGIDSNVAAGLVMSSAGKLYSMTFDGDPMGGGGTSPERQRWGKSLCPKPFRVRVTASGRLTCYPPQPRRPGDIMSPTFEPY